MSRTNTRRMTHPLTVVVSALVLIGGIGAGCSSSDTEDGSGGSGATGGSAGSAASGGQATGGGGQATGGGGSGGMAGADASADAPVDVIEDVTVDPFEDAPPRPVSTGPMTIVMFGFLDGIELTGTYTMPGTTPDVCGAGFLTERADPFGTEVEIAWKDDMANLTPTVGVYDETYGFDISISRFVKIDGASKNVVFRAGQSFANHDGGTSSQLEGEVYEQDLDGMGTFDAFFHVTAAERFVDENEGVRDGDLYIWVAGDCRP